MTRFFGRDTELKAVEDRFRAGARLLTITGPPGVGKTRLALEYGLARRHRFLGGAWFADLSAATSTDDVVAAVLAAMGVEDGPDAAAAIGPTLADRGAALLILDSAEPVIDATREVATAWLAAAPALQLLVTSGERLRLPGEQLVELAPLPATAAAEMFVDRAGAVYPQPALDHDAREIVAAIADRLDRLPLAIELTATRTRAIGLPDLLQRLDRPMKFLDLPMAGVPAHHATLRAAVTRAWARLDANARAVLAQASVFRGSISLAAAEAVIDAPPGGDMLGCFETLVDRSLVVAQRCGDRVRFSLYAAVRELADETLDDDDRAGAWQRHARYFAGLASPAPDDHANLLSAHARLVAGSLVLADGPRLAADLALALAAPSPRASNIDVVRITGESIDLLARDAVAPSDDEIAATVALLTARANALVHNRDFARAEEDIDRALEIAPWRGPNPLLSRAHHMRFQILLQQWRMKEARQAADDAVASCPSTDLELQATLLSNCGILGQLQGDVHRARTLFEKALALAERHGARDQAERARAGLCGALCDLQLYDEARTLLLRALATPETSRYHWNYLRGCAHIEQQLGNFELSRDYFGRARAAMEALDHKISRWAIDLDLAVLAMDAGDPARARIHALRAKEELASTRAPRNRIIATALLLAIDAPDMEPAERDRRQARIERLARDIQDSRMKLIVQLSIAHIDLARASETAEVGDIAGADELRQRALEALNSAAAWERRSDEIRVHARILRRAMARGALVVGERPAMVCTPGGDRIQLERNSVPYRLLSALVHARQQTPGRPAARAELLQSVWPDGEVNDLGINRLKVHVTKLRKMGFKHLIVFRAPGYLLDDAVPLLRVVHADSWPTRDDDTPPSGSEGGATRGEGHHRPS